MAEKEGLLVSFLVFYFTISNVMSSHFRGGIIMVRPQPGGGPKEVSGQYLIII